MGRKRYVDTKFWDDNFIISLNPTEKLLYIYLLTNPLCNIAGMYEITIKRMSFDTGIRTEKIKGMLEKFSEKQKVIYQDSFLVIKNFLKNQKLNANMKIGVLESLNSLPISIKDSLSGKKNKPCRAFASLDKALKYFNLYFNYNSNNNLNIKPPPNKDIPPPKKDENIIPKKFPQFNLVKMTEAELNKLIDKFGEDGAKQRIENLHLYIGSTGKKYKSHYLTVLNWERMNPLQTKLEVWTKTDYFASECPDCGGIRYFWVKGKQKKAICGRCQKKEGIKNG